MDNYEVNVLTRKGGWKKLPQEIIEDKNESKFNNSDNLNINVTEDTFESKNLEDFNSNCTCKFFGICRRSFRHQGISA